MSAIDRNESELRRLLLVALDGDATDQQLAQLNDLLLADEAARRSASRFLQDDSILREEIGTLETALSFLQQAGKASKSTDAEAAADELPPIVDYFQRSAVPDESSRSTTGAIRGKALRVAEFVNAHGLAVAVAALVLFAAFAWQYNSLLSRFDDLYELAALEDAEKSRGGRSGKNRAPSPTTPPVARVTGLDDCMWSEGAAEFKFGDTLQPGDRLQLTQGVLQLTYDTGAKVVVEGPVDLVMTTGIEAKLAAGKVAAAVPRFARGYTILTPTAEVVDLGTEFGVEVDSAGDSEVHVFDGDVVTRAAGEHGVGALVHAKQDEAVAINGAEAEPRRIRFDGAKFVRRLVPDIPADKLPSLPITSNLALWLAADLIPIEKEGEPVATWPDILIGDNRFPDDAWQFDERLCPIWVRDGEGRPAVRFDGWSNYLATSPMETTNQQTAFVVCSSSPASFASAQHGGILLKYGLDAPTLELTMLTDHRPRGLVWAGEAVKNKNPTNVGIVEGAPIAPLAPCAVAYQYDAVGNRAELLVNGVSQGVTSAPRPLEQHAKKYVGSHAQPWYEAYYLGNIYEILVYDAALDQADCNKVFQYLSKRYDIELGR